MFLVVVMIFLEYNSSEKQPPHPRGGHLFQARNKNGPGIYMNSCFWHRESAVEVELPYGAIILIKMYRRQ
jgi:hypothetical protein